MSIPILPLLPPTDPSTPPIHDFLTNLSLSHTPLQIPASFYNNTAEGSGGRGEGGTLYILPERSFRLLQAVMIACFIMLCLLSWLAAFLTTRKVGMLAVELGVWRGVRRWIERRGVGGVRDGDGGVGKRGRRGGAGGGPGRDESGGVANGQEGEGGENPKRKKTTEGNFLDRILFQFLLLHQNQPSAQQEGQTIPHRDREPEESPHHHQHHIPNQQPHPPSPFPHLPTLPTLLITFLSLTKHIPLILCTSAPGNEILRWFIHLPEYAAVIIFMHGVWSLGAVVGVWGLLVWRDVRGKEIRRGREGEREREMARDMVRELDGTVEECGLERGRGGIVRERERGGGNWVVEVGMAV